MYETTSSICTSFDVMKNYVKINIAITKVCEKEPL